MVAVEPEPQDISGANGAQSPGFPPLTGAPCDLCQTRTSLVGSGLTTSQLVLAQLSAYRFQIDSVRGGNGAHVYHVCPSVT